MVTEKSMLALSNDEVMNTFGGYDLMMNDGGAFSRKSLLIGVGLTFLSPTLGAGYWLGYFINE